MNNIQVSFAAILVACVADVATAAIMLDLLPDGVTPAPGAYTNSSGNSVNELNVTFDNQLGGQQLFIQLTTGSMIGTTAVENPSTPGPGVIADDNLSFIALGGNTCFTSASILVPGGANSLGGAGSLTWSPTLGDITWAALPPIPSDGGPSYLVAQIVLSPDAQGTWSYLGTSGDFQDTLVHTGPVNTEPIGIGVITNGIMTISVPSTLDADFDEDGDKDGADFLAWQTGLGIASGATKAQGDADNNGTVDAADLGIWESQYGNGTLAAASIPEPTTYTLALAALCLAMSRRRIVTR